MKYTDEASLIRDVKKHFANPVRKNIALEVRRWEEQRSDNQQAKLHILIRDISNEAGVSNSEYFKQKYIKENVHGIFPFWPHDLVVDRRTGTTEMHPKSESKLTKREESEMIERLYALAAEWGVEIAA